MHLSTLLTGVHLCVIPRSCKRNLQDSLDVSRPGEFGWMKSVTRKHMLDILLTKKDEEGPQVCLIPDKVRMYEEIMTNDDNLESNLPTSSLLKMCCLVQVELCVYCPVAGDVLTVKVLPDLTLQVNLFSRKIIYWLPQFTRKYNGMFINSHKSRCGRLRV